MTTMHLTPEQVSERYAGRVTVETLAQWRWRKRGPRYMKLGRSVLYSVRDLEAWEARRVVNPDEAAEADPR